MEDSDKEMKGAITQYFDGRTHIAEEKVRSEDIKGSHYQPTNSLDKLE